VDGTRQLVDAVVEKNLPQKDDKDPTWPSTVPEKRASRTFCLKVPELPYENRNSIRVLQFLTRNLVDLFSLRTAGAGAEANEHLRFLDCKSGPTL
jgi:hypothetical protein